MTHSHLVSTTRPQSSIPS